MSPDIAVRCAGLSKTYTVRTQNLRGLIGSLLRRHTGGTEQRVEALCDVSFEVRKGEVFGIIGGNGAGKSTLLACIAGVTRHDSGTVTINGHVDSILKIGVGFHPNLTGRENVVIGAISMGVPVNEALAAVGEIIAFAELEKFADMPFYTYSSGMQARLQFAVAVHRAPDIFIVDEALATGDARFVKKSQRRIEEICTGGSTVLLVTHSVQMVESLCQRALWLEEGRMIAYGSAVEVGNGYRKKIMDDELNRRSSMPTQGNDDRGTGEVTIESVRVIGGDGRVLHYREPMTIEVAIDAKTRIEKPRINMQFYLAQGNVFISSFGDEHLDASTGEWLEELDLGVIEGQAVVRIHFPSCPFAGNTYWCTFGLLPRIPRRPLETEDDWYVFRKEALVFQVISFPGRPRWVARTCVVEPPVDITIQSADEMSLRRSAG